jgi:hypothetical protein
MSAGIAPFIWWVKTLKTLRNRPSNRQFPPPKTLTPLILPPIRPPFLEMDEILDPRGRDARARHGGDGRGISDHVAAL